jgi:hypothetical protein
LPLGWQLEELPFFVLKFTHSSVLDPDESALDVKLNGKPIGSTHLDDSNAREGELRVSFPARLLKAGGNRLEVEVEMNFPESDNIDKCRVLQDGRAWTMIDSESEIFLPYSTVDPPPDLRLFPYPFSHYSGLDGTLFVLPDRPTAVVFEQLIRLAARLGSPTTTEYLSAHAAYAQEAIPETWRDYNLILLGRPTENTLLSEFGEHLPHPFMADSDLLEPLVIDSVAFQPDPDRDAGLLQILTSPWSERRTLLAITGTTDEGVQLAVQALLEQADRLGGNLAVIEPSLDSLPEEPTEIRTYSTDTRPPTPREEIASAAESDLDVEGGADEIALTSDQMLLAERWWK